MTPLPPRPEARSRPRESPRERPEPWEPRELSAVSAPSRLADDPQVAPGPRLTPAPPEPESPPGPAALPALPTSSDGELLIARLEGQVAALEAALERRSHELQALQRLLCPRDLAQWARLTAGLPPLPRIAYEPAYWHETRELTVADVQEALEALWSSIHPQQPQQPQGPAGSAAPARSQGR